MRCAADAQLMRAESRRAITSASSNNTTRAFILWREIFPSSAHLKIVRGHTPMRCATFRALLNCRNAGLFLTLPAAEVFEFMRAGSRISPPCAKAGGLPRTRECEYRKSGIFRAGRSITSGQEGRERSKPECNRNVDFLRCFENHACSC